MREPSLLEKILNIVAPSAIILVLLSGIFSPIIGYVWYVKHGGAKKWFGWLAFLPLLLAIVFLLLLFLNNISRY